MLRQSLEVSVDYRQFYVWDVACGRRAPEEYSDSDVKNMVKVAVGLVVVQPARNGTVPVNLAVQDLDPGFEHGEWDHVVETGLEASTGKMEVHECMGGPVVSFDVRPGAYRVRVLFSGIGTLSSDGMRGDDRYEIVLWPGNATGLSVVKWWPGDAAD